MNIGFMSAVFLTSSSCPLASMTNTACSPAFGFIVCFLWLNLFLLPTSFKPYCLCSEFLFPNRLHRLAYFLRLAAVNIFCAFLYSCSTIVEPRIWWSLIGTIFVYGNFFIVLPRLRDVGMSAWWLLAGLVPGLDFIIGIIHCYFGHPLCFSPSRRPRLSRHFKLMTN